MQASEENAARTFGIKTTRDRASLLVRAKRVALENGATFAGDRESGRFSHSMIKGEYRIVGDTVIVTVTEKHWLVPWDTVDGTLRELFR
jgi:hypothetical protein